MSRQVKHQHLLYIILSSHLRHNGTLQYGYLTLQRRKIKNLILILINYNTDPETCSQIIIDSITMYM